MLNHGELVCTNNDNVCGSLQFRDCKFRCIPHTEEAFHPPKKVKSLLKRPKQKKCNGMEELFKRSQWQRISEMYKKRRVFGRSTALDRLLKNKAGNRREKAWLLYRQPSEREAFGSGRLLCMLYSLYKARSREQRERKANGKRHPKLCKTSQSLASHFVLYQQCKTNILVFSQLHSRKKIHLSQWQH